MRKIKLLKGWLGHKVGDILEVDNNVSFGLVDSGVATLKFTERKIVDEYKTTKEMSATKINNFTDGNYKIK